MGVGTSADASIVAATTLRVVATAPPGVWVTVVSVACAWEVTRAEEVTAGVTVTATGGAELWRGGRSAVAVAATVVVAATASRGAAVPPRGTLPSRLAERSARPREVGWNGPARLSRMFPGAPTRGSRGARAPADARSASPWLRAGTRGIAGGVVAAAAVAPAPVLAVGVNTSPGLAPAVAVAFAEAPVAEAEA